MKFFEAVPCELFSPLASPNRALYADALDVLYTAYRENLKIREDTLYSMLRSRLEQQLADATFEGEDIDEEELRDISGRARFLIRKLCGKAAKAGLKKSEVTILRSILPSQVTAASCWHCFTSSGMIARLADFPMCLAPTLL